MTYKDIKGDNRIKVIVPDQPILAEDKVRSLGDPIAIVAAQTKEQALAAAAAVKVVYEPLPVYKSPVRRWPTVRRRYTASGPTSASGSPR